MGKLNLSRFKNKHLTVLFGNGLNSVTGILTSALLFHFLSIKEMGLWFFILSIVGLCEGARNGFLANGTIAFYAGTDAKRGASVLGSVWFLAFLITAVIFLLNVGAYFFWPATSDEETRLCLKWVGITYLSSFPSDVISWKLQAEEKYFTMSWYKLLNGIASVVAYAILFALHKMTLENALMYNFLTNCLQSVLGICLNMGGVRTIFHRSRECIIELVQYGKYTLGTTSFSILMGNVDIWMINYLLGPASIAYYGLANRLMPLIEMPMRAFATTGMSDMAIAYNHKDMREVARIFKKYAGMLTIAFIPVTVGALLLADVALNLLGGAKYHGSIAPDLYRVFMVIALMYPIDRFNGLALDMTHKTKVNFYKVVLMLVVKVLANFAGIALFQNLYGIAFSLFMVTLAAVIYGNMQLRKYLDYTIPGILTTGYQEIKLLLATVLRPSTSTRTPD